MFLRVNCWEINQITWKYQKDFFNQNFQKKVNITIKFQLKLTILNFWTKFTKKGYFWSKKKKKWKSPSNFTYSNCCRFQISPLTMIFGFLKHMSQNRILPVKKRKNEHRHWIFHIQISLSTKLQLNLTIFVCWIKLAKKGYFQS